ncbi:MAG: leucine-rich repeat protein [Clostridia bacterium]|nr:leucine-rich repeat protein [Clostridia bacterium]
MKKSTIIRYLSMAACAAVITGVITACGESRTPNSSAAPALSAPENLYVSYNQTTEYETEYILTWDKVEDADWYEITVGGKTFTTKKTSYEVTNYCTEGETARMSVKAISEADDFRDSKAANIKEKIEEITNGIIYNKRTNGGYEAVFASAVEGRLVLPDTYNGQAVKKISKAHAYTILHEKLTSVRFPKHLTEIGTNFFFLSKLLTEVALPDGLTTIEDGAFGGTDRLNNVVLPTKLTVIGEDAFDRCGIENLFVPKSVKEMGSAFAGCENLKTVTFEQGSKLKEIAETTFCECGSLTEIALPEGLQTIGEAAFHYCTNLAEIELPEALQTIEYEAFQHCERLTTLHLPKGVTNLQGGALCNPAFTAFTVAEDNPAYQVIDGNIYSKDGTQFVQYAIGKTASEFTVPNGVTKLGDYAFALAENLLRINLPQGLTEIGNSVFIGCAITEIELPYGLTTIGEYAFADKNISGPGVVSNLTSIVLPDSVTSFGKEAFSNSNLTELILSKNIKVFKAFSLTGLRVPVLELPEGVMLEQNAFLWAYIPKVVIPKDFKMYEGDLSLFAGIGVFNPEIFYKGTSEEWEALKRNGVFNENTFVYSGGAFGEEPVRIPLTIYFYSETEPTEEGNFWRYVDGVPTPWGEE